MSDTNPADPVREWWIHKDATQAEGAVYDKANIALQKNPDYIHVVEKSSLDRALATIEMLKRVSDGQHERELIALNERAAMMRERDSLRAEVERLRTALERIDEHTFESDNDRDVLIEFAREALKSPSHPDR